MITEVGNDNLVLNVPLLEWGTTAEKFCLVSQANIKTDSLGKTFIQCVLRGKDGTPVIGRIFGDDVHKYASEIEKYIGKVALVSYLVDIVYGQKSLTIYWMVLPEGEDMRGIKADLFEAIIPNVSKYVEDNEQLFNTHTSIFTPTMASLFKQKAYTSLLYASNEEVCSGKSGYVYVLLNTCWHRCELYKELGYITSAQLSLMMIAQLLCECILHGYSDLRFDYNYLVYDKIAGALSIIDNIGTTEERSALKEIITGYTNARLGAVSTKTEHRLAQILYQEYSVVYNNLKYLTTLETYTGTATIGGKLVR